MNRRTLAGVVTLLALASSLPAQITRRGGPVDTELTRSSGSLVNVWSGVIAPITDSVVRLRIDGTDVALGTIVSADGLILTKADQIYAEPTATLSDGRTVPAKLVAVAARSDLALLRIEAGLLTPVKFRTEPIAVGCLTASAGVGRLPVGLGIVGTPPRRGTAGYLGVALDPSSGGVRIAGVVPKAPAAAAGLRPNDLIVSIDDRPAEALDGVQAQLRSTAPGSSVRLRVRRGEEELELEVTLAEFPTFTSDRSEMQNRMGGELSRRGIGFELVVQHDTVLRPNDVGGPLVDLDGNVIGLNIARVGRVETYAIPGASIPALLDELRSGKLPATYAPKPPAEPNNIKRND